MLAYNLKTLAGPITFLVVMVAEVTKNMQYLYQRSQRGIVPAARAVYKAADVGETSSCKQTSGLTLYIQTSLARKILPWTTWLCSEEHTFAKLFEEL